MELSGMRIKWTKIVVVVMTIGAMIMTLPLLTPESRAGDKGSDEHQKMTRPNHLIHEKSPYLIQHAHNPVDWYPWGDEAFAKARRENKPILLSIGYSTCHWCHVMERESFSNTEIAAIMNKYLVCIKVDREERPDLDQIYIAAVSAMTGSAGWPLNVFLTPEGKPFFGGTYFPPTPRGGRPGFPQLVEQIGKAWQSPEARKKIISSSGELTETLKHYLAGSTGNAALDSSWLDKGFEFYRSGYDARLGGFGAAPKFPSPLTHNFLLRYYASVRNEKGGKEKAKKALEMSLNTLRSMARGGIYDQIGGGFHRYATDARWHVPHFEKMLYDNAQLAVNYLEAYQITGEAFFADIARGILDYILRDMTNPGGGFYSAEDADSLPMKIPGKPSGTEPKDKEEGAFYVWETEELKKMLTSREYDIFRYHYGIRPEGNAESDPFGEFKGKNILFVAHSLTEAAGKFNMSEREIQGILDECRKRLYNARLKRPRPHLDDKVLTSWNGLMISAFARGYQILGDTRYIKAGERAANFIRDNLCEPQKRELSRRWRENEKGISGTANDYAFLAQGLIDLYEASFDPRWLYWGIELVDEQKRRFYDSTNGGLFLTAPEHDANLITRVKTGPDNVTPSASSVSTMNFLRISQFTGRQDRHEAAEKTLRSFGPQMNNTPGAFPQMLTALNSALSKPLQIIIAGDPSAPETFAMLKEVHKRFIPNKILIVMGNDPVHKTFANQLSFLQFITQIEGRPTAYICINRSCRLPTNDVKEMGKLLDQESPS